MFRTQINQDSGFVLRGLSVNFIDPAGGSGLADRVRLDASGFGGNPAGRLRFDMGRDQTYRLRLFYQEFKTFSALPAFANPLLDDGIVPGQHTWDRTRNVLDLQLELPLWAKFTPIVGFRWNRYEGPGQTTYSVGNDEFRLASDLEQTESEFYVGFNFQTKAMHGTLIQGWRNFDGTDRQQLAAGEGVGNNPGDTLGQPVELDDFERNNSTSAETPVTTFHMTARASDQVRLVASYVYADAEGDATLTESLSGSLVSFQLARFFQGLDQTIDSRTESPFSRGELRAEFDITRNIGLRGWFETRKRELSGWSMVSSLFSETLTFTGLDPRDIQVMAEAENGYERNDEIGGLRLDFRNLGAFTVWAEYAVNNQKVGVDRDIAQIVLPGGQEGRFDRRVQFYEVGGMVNLGNGKILLDYSGQDADDVIMRTDFNDRSRIRGRIDWSFGQFLRVLGTAETIDSNNNDSNVGYEAETTRYAIDLDLTPTDNFMLGLSWDTYQTDTEMPIVIPQSLAPGLSVFSEDGVVLTGDLRWLISIFTLEAAYSTFENTGSFPLTMDRAFGRVAVDISKQFAVAAEYEMWDYKEDNFAIADYDANRYGVYLRWHR
jgi:hypothetical protein